MVRRIGAYLPLTAVGLLVLCSPADAQRYSWQDQHARVLPTGDLQWQPEAFAFTPGRSVRYIDYEDGDDSHDGRSKSRPWKHHPWDREASGKAKQAQGIHTYVFKRGVIYRGTLIADESGEPGDPIRLTSDPAWGQGEAMIYGSERVTGWKRGASHEDIPDAQRVWQVDLDFAPRTLFMIRRDEITRIALARTPNWNVSNPDDIKSEWWTWQQPEWWTDRNKVTVAGKKMHLGVDRKHLTEDADYYRDAIVWTEWGIVMGTPHPSKVEQVTEDRDLAFQGVWYGDGEKVITRNRYYLEDKPHYLDQPGEFWFEKKGRGGRLYVRLPGDVSPNDVTLEAGKRINVVDSKGMSHVHVSGLTFRFTNVYWDYEKRDFEHPDIDSACVRLLGSGRDLSVRNCMFEFVHKAVRVKAIGNDDRVDDVVVADNDVANTDHGAINVTNGTRWGKKDPPIGLLGDVKVLRNRLTNIGMRPIRSEHGHALNVSFPATCEIAGNILHRCYGAGIFVFGGKGSGETREAVFSRILIHHNKVTDPLLNTNDWGGIETWQGGPFYVYNNISGNPGGYWNWAYDGKRPGRARFGFAYYLDGAFKNYHFNNIAWGGNNDPLSPLCNFAPFQEIHSYQNTFFNNTAYRFFLGTNRQAAHFGRDKFLGNIWQDISGWVFHHTRPADTEAAGNAAHAGPQHSDIHHETNAVARNVFQDISGQFGAFEASGRWHSTLDSYREAQGAHGALASGTGVMASDPVVPGAGQLDFRPAPDSPAINRGVRVFVPWSLYATVGEWHFHRSPKDPSTIYDEHWTMTRNYVGREEYWKQPMSNLTGVGIAAEDFGPGPLEDWTAGALTFDGNSQYAVLRHEDIGEAPRSVSLGKSSFIIEAYFKTQPGHTGGSIASKLDGKTGYKLWVNAHGHPELLMRIDGKSMDIWDMAVVNDGRWHHVLVEIARGESLGLDVWVDGKQAPTPLMAIDTSSEPQQASQAKQMSLEQFKHGSLDNEADFVVGREFAGSIDFLRVALGTLADAKTDIHELYEWQFNGPQYRDFTGRDPVDQRDAGAIEFRP